MAEVRSVLKLAGPLAVAEVGWMMQGIVDTMMVGRLPDAAVAIGATSIAGNLFYSLAIFFGGLLLGMDPLVSQAFGAGKVRDCNHTLINAVYMMAALSIPLMVVNLAFMPVLRAAGVHPAVMAQVEIFSGALVWSMPSLLLFMALRHYLQAMNYAFIIMVISVIGNVVNLVLNWVLIYGHWGFPAMGIVGSAWSTVIGRASMLIIAVGYLLYVNRRDRLDLFSTDFSVDLSRVIQIVRYGLPAALQIGLELAVFFISAVLIARLGPVPIAGHQVALMVVAFTYMVPLGIGQAAAVRVGQAIGAGDPIAGRRAGWVAIAMGAAFMSGAAIVLVSAPRAIVRIFTADAQVLAAGATLVMIASIFQLFDGLQTVCTGALRGTGETRIPMLTFLFGYWFIGMPLGYWLCFHGGWGARGLWAGFCAALITVGIILLSVWRWKSQQMCTERRVAA